MKDAKFTKLINKAAKMAHDQLLLIKEIDEESVRRHGYHPSEVDCDPLIDALQYGIADVDGAEEFDKLMREAIQDATNHAGNVRTI